MVLFLSEIILCVTFLGDGCMFFGKVIITLMGFWPKLFKVNAMSVQAFIEGMLKQCFTVIGHGHVLAGT